MTDLSVRQAVILGRLTVDGFAFSVSTEGVATILEEDQ